jgi:hypothetical protein
MPNGDKTAQHGGDSLPPASVVALLSTTVGTLYGEEAASATEAAANELLKRPTSVRHGVVFQPASLIPSSASLLQHYALFQSHTLGTVAATSGLGAVGLPVILTLAGGAGLTYGAYKLYQQRNETRCHDVDECEFSPCSLALW